jgi:hypothetical protein
MGTPGGSRRKSRGANARPVTQIRKLAVKYHELAKFANPPYLGDFYRGVAVRYVFMAQELSQEAEKALGLAAQPRDSHIDDVSTETTHDLNLLAVWAADKRSMNHAEQLTGTATVSARAGS